MSGLRDSFARFSDAGAQVLGVSTDDVATQKKFAESLKLPFPLLADEGGRAARAYGVFHDGYADRVTFVIDVTGREPKIAQVIEGKDAIDPAPAVRACTLPGRAAP